ncbi:MAG: dihydroorotase [Burkholderiaceae bacterium]|jgi:dihydroorotase
MRILIRNGRLLDPAAAHDGPGDLAIADGRIVQVAAGFQAERVLDAAGCFVIPGVVDLSARLREPGFEYKATLESELQAALAGGVTALVCPPDTDPVLDEPGLVEMLKFRARALDQTHVYPLGALTVGLQGERITEMAELAEAGCIGFSQAEVAVANTLVLMRALEYAQTFGQTVWLRPQDAWLGKGVAHAGAYAARMGLAGIPVMAETLALMTIFELVRATGARVHICRVSSAAGIELIRRAKADRLPVTCDVGIHHVHLIDLDIGYFDRNARLTPPLREQRDRAAISDGLQDGTIDAICSDHTPVDDDAKLLPFAQAEPGATGLELLLTLTLKWAAERQVPFVQALALITNRPALLAGLPAVGLQIGMPADVCIFDPTDDWRVSTDTLVSQGRHTPYLGYTLSGRVRATIIGGRIAFERGGPVLGT